MTTVIKQVYRCHFSKSICSSCLSITFWQFSQYLKLKHWGTKIFVWLTLLWYLLYCGGLELEYTASAPSEVQNADNNCSVCQRETLRPWRFMCQVHWWAGPEQRGRSDWCQKPRTTRGSDMKRCQLWAVLCCPGGRCECSEYYEATAEYFAPVWAADHHFFRPRNSP